MVRSSLLDQRLPVNNRVAESITQQVLFVFGIESFSETLLKVID